jgi:hypothetical protein
MHEQNVSTLADITKKSDEELDLPEAKMRSQG